MTHSIAKQSLCIETYAHIADDNVTWITPRDFFAASGAATLRPAAPSARHSHLRRRKWPKREYP
jgi:hypothetical protein